MKNDERELTVLECGKCTAFFIDRSDYEKHRRSHEDAEVEEGDDVLGAADTSLLPRSRKLKAGYHEARPNARWRSSGRQKLRIKIGGNLVVKKTAHKMGGSYQESSSETEEFSQPRRSARVHYQECSESDEDGKTAVAEEEKEAASKKTKRIKPENAGGGLQDRQPTRKKKKDCKRKLLSHETTTVVVSEIDEQGNETDCFNVQMQSKLEDDKPEILTKELEAVGKVVKKLKERKLNLSAASGDEPAVKRRKPRLKRLRRTLDDDDKSQTIYTCAHCLRNFRRKSNLKRHMSKLHCGKEKDEAADSSKWFTGYCCDVCGEGLQLRSSMMAHRDVLHGRMPEMEWCKYQTSLARVKFCGSCKKYFRAGKLFDEHKCDNGAGIVDEEKSKLMKQAEEVPPTYLCHVCNQCFRWKWDYRLHRETEHKDTSSVDWSTIVSAKLEYFCGKCSKAYNNNDELESHQCSATPLQNAADAVVKPFRCDICGNDYFWKSDFRRHMRTKHPKENYRPTEHDTIIYSCPYCEEKFSMKKRILHHMRKVHSITSDSPFVCVKCNKVFRRRDNLDRHNESYHPTLKDEGEATAILSTAEIRINGEVAYHCQICNRNIANPNRFISHYRGHYSETKFTCDLCGKQAKTQHQLNTHIKNIHLNIRNYKCDICNKSFYTKQACEEHRRIHTGERPFSCEICGKTFVAGNALISHKRFHNDFYPHSCHMCPKKFKVRRSLINHIRTHTGERPFKCDLCTKTFNNSSQYSYHKKVTHSEARPFCCSLCGNCFKANKFLSRHMELHAVRSQIQSRKPNNPAVYVTAQTKQDTRTHTSTVQVLPATGVPVAQMAESVAAPTAPTTVHVVPHYETKEPMAGYRNDDIAVALYNLQRGCEPAGNQFVRQAECERPFTAAESYVAAVNYALASTEDYKTSPTRPYNANQQPASTVVAGKHMTWLS